MFVSNNTPRSSMCNTPKHLNGIIPGWEYNESKVNIVIRPVPNSHDIGFGLISRIVVTVTDYILNKHYQQNHHQSCYLDLWKPHRFTSDDQISSISQWIHWISLLYWRRREAARIQGWWVQIPLPAKANFPPSIFRVPNYLLHFQTRHFPTIYNIGSGRASLKFTPEGGWLYGEPTTDPHGSGLILPDGLQVRTTMFEILSPDGAVMCP